MHPEFNNIVNKLQTDSNTIIEIKDFETGKDVVSKKSDIGAIQMIEKYGSIDGFFKSIFEKHPKIQAQLHKMQGTARIRVGLAHNFGTAASTQEVKNTVEEKKETPMNTTPAQQQPQMGLNMPGLGFPDLINLHVDKNMLAITKSELDHEKSERKRLEKENDDLKEQIRGFERKQDNKDFWAGLIKEAAPALSGLAMAFKPGLNGPQSQGDQLQIPQGFKGSLIQYILNSKEMSEQQANTAYFVLEAYAKGHLDFIQDLNELINKYNFNGNDNHN